MKIVQVNGNEIRKVFRYIKTVFSKDSHTSAQIAPFGDDSCPTDGMKGIEASTDDLGQNIVIGYFNRKALAEKGEKRFYSLKPDGTDSFYIWMKNNGTCEIGGNTDNLVRYIEMNSALQLLVTDINGELAKIQTAIGTLGGTYARTTMTLTMTKAKINEIKTIAYGD